ncbi:Annexin, partial [Saitoella complicata NRRL Y-17804]
PQPPQHQQPYGYGAPPPVPLHPNQYGGPPPHSPQPCYGAPAPPAPYGSHSPGYPPVPAQAPYGAPSPIPGPYGHSPAPAPYGAPPPPAQLYGGGGGYHSPSPYGNPQGSWNPESTIQTIRKATKGFGTDEAALIAALAPLTPHQMSILVRAFESQVGKPLMKVIESETSSRGYFQFGLRGLVLGPVAWEAWLLHRACSGPGTKEVTLTELLLGRTDEEIFALKAEYERQFRKPVDKAIRGELSMKTERFFNMALAAGRAPAHVPIDHNQVTNDAHTCHNGMHGLGTDEIPICGIFSTRSLPHLSALAQTYQSLYRRPLLSAIQSDFSGHMRDGLVQILAMALNPAARKAELLEAAMAGAGTKDELLCMRVIRGRWGVDGVPWERVKGEYARMYGKSLVGRVKGDTSGDYERLMVAIIGN